MTDTDNNESASKAPTHTVCVAQQSGGKTYWTRIGAGWQHKKGPGINLRLIANPIDGCLSIFLASDQPE
jgi:hypothetical protein